MKIVQCICLMACLVFAVSVVARSADDPVTGTWVGDWGPSPSDRNQVTVELKWDGKALTGTINPGANAVEVKNGTFDEKTNAVHLEADAKSRSGKSVHYMVDGKVDNNTMSGTWNHDNRKGDFKITKK